MSHDGGEGASYWVNLLVILIYDLKMIVIDKYDDDDDHIFDDNDGDDHLVCIEEHAATKEAGEASGKEEAGQDNYDDLCW